MAGGDGRGLVALVLDCRRTNPRSGPELVLSGKVAKSGSSDDGFYIDCPDLRAGDDHGHWRASVAHVQGGARIVAARGTEKLHPAIGRGRRSEPFSVMGGHECCPGDLVAADWPAADSTRPAGRSVAFSAAFQVVVFGVAVWMARYRTRAGASVSCSRSSLERSSIAVAVGAALVRRGTGTSALRSNVDRRCFCGDWIGDNVGCVSAVAGDGF